MRARTHTILKAFLALVLCFGMLITVMPATPASAAKMTNKKAQKILKKKIKNKFAKYTFVDLDKDKIDEMIAFTYSGKFVENCDASKKTVTVYKVSGKKAKAVLTASLDGDFFQPEFGLDLYYYNKKSYITVHEVHEGYSDHNTYVFEGGKYKSYAGTSEEISEEDTVYYVDGIKNCTKADYVKATEKIFASELSCEMQLSPAKTTNKYLKKLFKARYDYAVEREYIPKGSKYSFSDFDGDGLLEMFVETGKKSGYILYAIGKYDLSSAFGANSLSYTLDADGDYVWGWDAFQYDNENGTALQYTGRWIAENNFYIDVTREGEKYVFHVKYYPNAFDSEEWIYFTDYLGESEDLMASFSCLDGGTHTSCYTDRTTGEEISDFEYVGGAEFYYTYGEGFTWLDLDDPAGSIGSGVVFERVREDDED